MTDVFRECRERVSAQDAARHYGLTFDRKGWAVCPFHSDKHPSMSFRSGRFRCWACNASGDAIDFTGKLLGLEPMAAVERLNADFALSLPLHRKPTPAERREAERAARRRRELSETAQLFETWRGAMLDKLAAVFRMAHLALKECHDLTDAEALAVREQAHIEHLSDLLLSGSMEDMMQIFRERGRVDRLCEKILQTTQTKSEAA